MAIIKAITSGAGLKTAIDYITRRGKLDFKQQDGIECNPATAYNEFMITKERYQKLGGTQYIHLVLSLSPKESRNTSDNELLDMARGLIAKAPYFTGYQVVLAVHTDKAHKHAHIVINSVNLDTGRKIQFNKVQLREFKGLLIEQALERGLEIPQKGQGKTTGGHGLIRRVIDRTEQDETTKEFYYKRAGETCKSWVTEIAYKVKQATATATSKEDFIESLKGQGVTVSRYKDTGNPDKDYITFCIDVDGKQQKVKNTRLTEIFRLDYTVKGINDEFTRNAGAFSRAGVETLAGDSNQQGGTDNQPISDNTGAGATDRAINGIISDLAGLEAGAGAIKARINTARTRAGRNRTRAKLLALKLKAQKLRGYKPKSEPKQRIRVKYKYRGY